MKEIILDNGYKLVFEKAFEEDEVYQCTGYILKDDELSDNFSGIGLFATFEDVKIELMKYLIQIEKVEITKDNIHLYYEFMSDKDLICYQDIVDDFIFNRKMDVFINLFGENIKIIDLPRCDNLICSSGVVLRYSLFGIKDTLKPIEEYIQEIKESESYKNFIATK